MLPTTMTLSRLFLTILMMLSSAPLVTNTIIMAAAEDSTASTEQQVPFPNVEFYIVCRNPDLKPGNSTSSTDIVETEILDYYQTSLLSLENDQALTMTIQSTVDSCVADDVVEITASSEGSIDWSMVEDTNDNATETYTASELQSMITEETLRDHFDGLCDTVLTFEARIGEAGTEIDEGWWQQSSSSASSVTDDAAGLTAGAIAGIVVGGLVLICLLVFCCCCMIIF